MTIQNKNSFLQRDAFTFTLTNKMFFTFVFIYIYVQHCSASNAAPVRMIRTKQLKLP